MPSHHLHLIFLLLFWCRFVAGAVYWSIIELIQNELSYKNNLQSIKLYIAAVVNWYAGVFCLSVNERSGRPESRSDRQSVSGGLAAEKALNFFRPFLASA